MSGRIPRDHQIDLENWVQTEQRMKNQGRGDAPQLTNCSGVVYAVILGSVCWTMVLAAVGVLK